MGEAKVFLFGWNSASLATVDCKVDFQLTGAFARVNT